MAIKWDEILKNPDKNHKVPGRALLNQKKKIEELEAKIKEFEETRENINKMHDSMMSEMASKDKIIDDTKKELESINKKNETLQNTIKGQEKELSNQSNKIKELEEKVTELEEKVKENINLTEEIGQLKNEIEKYKDSETNLKIELQKVKDSESELSNELQKVAISESELKTELQQAKDSEAKAQSEIQNLKNELDSIKEKLPIGEDKEQIEKLQQEISNVKEEIENYKKTVDQNNRQIEELNQTIKDKDTEIESLKEAPAATAMPSGPVAEMVPVKGKESAINTLQNLLNEAKSSVLIVTPDIKDIQDLPLQDIRRVVRIDIATGVTDKSIYNRLLEVRPSVRIRDNPHIDRWGIGIDGEKMFFAAEAEDPIGFITTNRRMMDFVSAILTESWVRGRRL